MHRFHMVMVTMNIPIISGIVTAGLIGIWVGFKWHELQEGQIISQTDSE